MIEANKARLESIAAAKEKAYNAVNSAINDCTTSISVESSVFGSWIEEVITYLTDHGYKVTRYSGHAEIEKILKKNPRITSAQLAAAIENEGIETRDYLTIEF